MASQHEEESLDLYNNIIKEYCTENASLYKSDIILNINSTFKEIVDFFGLFKRFEYEHNLKKVNSPDFINTLRAWITEIKEKVGYKYGKYLPHSVDFPNNPHRSYTPLSYWRTVEVKDITLSKLYHNLFIKKYNYDNSRDFDRRRGYEYDYYLDSSKLIEIGEGFVYAYKLPELEKELTLLQHEKVQNTSPNTTDEFNQLPEYEYKTEIQKVAWLHETGVIETIVNNSKNEGTINCTRAAKIIHSFTNINFEILKKCLESIYTPNAGNKKNHPFNNPENKLFVMDMAAKFKLNKPT